MNPFNWFSKPNSAQRTTKRRQLQKSLSLEHLEPRSMMSVAPMANGGDYASYQSSFDNNQTLYGYLASDQYYDNYEGADDYVYEWTEAQELMFIDLATHSSFASIGVNGLASPLTYSPSAIIIGGQYSGVVADMSTDNSPPRSASELNALLLPIDVSEPGHVLYDQPKLSLGSGAAPRGEIYIPQTMNLGDGQVARSRKDMEARGRVLIQDYEYYSYFESEQRFIADLSKKVLDKQLNWAKSGLNEARGSRDALAKDLATFNDQATWKSLPADALQDLNDIMEPSDNKIVRLQAKVNLAAERVASLKEAVSNLADKLERHERKGYTLLVLQTKVLLHCARVELKVAEARQAMRETKVLQEQVENARSRESFSKLIDVQASIRRQTEQKNIEKRLQDSTSRDALLNDYSQSLKVAADAAKRAKELQDLASNKRVQADNAERRADKAHDKVVLLRKEVEKWHKRGAESKERRAEAELKSAKATEKGWDKQAAQFNKSAKALEKRATLERAVAAKALLPYRDMLEIDRHLKDTTLWSGIKTFVDITGNIVSLQTGYAQDMLRAALNNNKGLSSTAVQALMQSDDLLERVIKAGTGIGLAVAGTNTVNNAAAMEQARNGTRGQYIATCDKAYGELFRDWIGVPGGAASGALVGGLLGLETGPGAAFTAVALGLVGSEMGAKWMEASYHDSWAQRWVREQAGRDWDEVHGVR